MAADLVSRLIGDYFDAGQPGMSAMEQGLSDDDPSLIRLENALKLIQARMDRTVSNYLDKHPEVQ